MDKITKIGLAITVLLLAGLLLRPASNPTLAQTALPPSYVHSQPQLAVSGSDVYILQNDTLYVYEWNSEIDQKINAITKPNPAKFNLILTRPLKVHP